MPDRALVRGTRHALPLTSLDGPTVRHLLTLDLPDLPHDLVYGADTYLLSIAVAAIMDGEKDQDHVAV